MVKSCLVRVVAVRAVLGALVVLSPALGGCDGMELNTRPGATSVLSAFSDPTPAEAAKWAIDKYDPNNRYRGTLLLAGAPFAGEPVYMELFRDNSDDPDPGVRGAAVRAIALHGQVEDAQILIDRLKDPEVSVRVEAARGLQRLHNPAAINGLLEVLDAEKEAEEDVRLEAALALGQYAENKVVEQLITSLADPSLAVNRNTLFSLRSLTGQDLGYDQKAWLLWYKGAGDAFAARGGYMYPAFSREKSWWEYLPFVKPPPNEPASVPVGMPTER